MRRKAQWVWRVANRKLKAVSAVLLSSQRSRTGAELGLGLMSLILAFVLTAIILLAMGANPLNSFAAIAYGALGNAYNLSQTAMVMAPLMLTGLAAAIPFSARIWNIGGEGQLYAGAVASVLFALTFGNAPGPILAVLSLLAGVLAGAAWGLIAAGLRVWRGANEVIVTLMLNFIALLLADYVITGPWAQGQEPQTRNIPAGVGLASLWPGSFVNLSPVLAFIALVIAWLVMNRTALGFAVRAVGLNAKVARLSGFSISGITLAAFGMGGACAGLAGAILVVGVQHALVPGISPNYGYTGVAVALIARLNPLWILPSAALFAIINVGGNNLPAATGISTSASFVIEAAFVILLLALRVLRFTYPEAA